LVHLHTQHDLPMTDLHAQLQTTLGDAYTIERELGGGGMSRVFVVTDQSLGRQIVVKVLAPDLAASLSADNAQHGSIRCLR
jgi:eukaryotic-like serine/threonine-protein kinase